MSWSEFAAGTLWAQLGVLEGESGRLNFAGTRVVSVPGEGLEPSRGKPSQDFKSCACFLTERRACSRFRLPENFFLNKRSSRPEHKLFQLNKYDLGLGLVVFLLTLCSCSIVPVNH